MSRAKANRKDSIAKPHLIWNAYVDLLAMSERADLTPVQAVAQLAFWYDSEVQNGGHLAYFLNKGIDEAKAAVDALPEIGAGAQHDVLASAIEYYVKSDIDSWETAQEYDALWRQGHFEEQDTGYYECLPEMTDLLQQYLDAHLSDFIELTDEPVRYRFEPPEDIKQRLQDLFERGLMPPGWQPPD